MKKIFITPTIDVIKINGSILMRQPSVQNVDSGDTGIDFGGGGSGGARSKFWGDGLLDESEAGE